MGGDQHAADGIDERTDPVAQKFGLMANRSAARSRTAKRWQRLLLFDGHAHLLAGDARVKEAGFFSSSGLRRYSLLISR